MIFLYYNPEKKGYNFQKFLLQWRETISNFKFEITFFPFFLRGGYDLLSQKTLHLKNGGKK